jgi:uncharacterized protein
MDITPVIPKNALVINRYGDGGFVINNEPHKGNVLLTAEKVAPWPVTVIDDATPESFAPLFAGGAPELLLIGTGTKGLQLSPQLKQFFREKKIAADSMDTGAACRTYSILLAEGRQVAAALIAV